jgi:hypothetical protein
MAAERSSHIRQACSQMGSYAEVARCSGFKSYAAVIHRGFKPLCMFYNKGEINMAHINAEFKHEDYEITVSVLEPTKKESKVKI